MEETNAPGDVPACPALNRPQRRVLGVLIEKGLTTPEYYPLTVKALLAGCNQKSNRDPVTNYDEEQVEQTLDELKSKGLVTDVLPSTGRAERWRQELGRRFQLLGPELAVLGELLLRGVQSEGELRGRANRMRPIADLGTLREILRKLSQGTSPWVRRVTPEGVQRGVQWRHGLYSNSEAAELGSAKTVAAQPPVTSSRTEPRDAGHDVGEATSSPNLAQRVEELERKVQSLERWVAARETRDP